MNFAIIESKRKKLENIKKTYPEAVIIDVTSQGEQPWVRFSPFYPHGNIPIPFSPEHYAESVEGIWQGLKVFEQENIDVTKFSVKTMKNLKRTVRTHGKVLGHRKGINGQELLSYAEARHKIYLPVYKWVLDNSLNAEIKQLQELNQNRDIVLLDYETNNSVTNLSKPLSHAFLVKCYIESSWPK